MLQPNTIFMLASKVAPVYINPSFVVVFYTTSEFGLRLAQVRCHIAPKIFMLCRIHEQSNDKERLGDRKKFNEAKKLKMRGKDLENAHLTDRSWVRF